MSWDITNPADTDSVRNGASVIRTFKQDIQTALNAEGSFPGSDPANPKFRWTPPQGATGAEPAAPVTGQLFIDTTLNVIKRWSGSAWIAVATLIPPGTVAPFFQAIAPLGWTQVTTQNDKVLRVVSDGTGGASGGTDSISAPPSHTHVIDTSIIIAGSQNVTNVGNQPVSPTEATVAFSPKYINVIICSKN